MAIPVIITFPASGAATIAALQTTGAAGTLPFPISYSEPSIQRKLTLTSGADISGVTFTFTGLDANGLAVTEDLLGPSSNTVTTVNEYSPDTRTLVITTDAAVSSAVSVGTGTVGTTRWIENNIHFGPFNVGLAVYISGTASVTVQDSPANNPVTDTIVPVFNHPVLAAITASAESNYAFPGSWTRAVLNSSTSPAVVVFYNTQAGVRN